VTDIRYDLFSVDDHIVELADVWSSDLPLGANGRCPAGHQSVLAGV